MLSHLLNRIGSRIRVIGCLAATLALIGCAGSGGDPTPVSPAATGAGPGVKKPLLPDSLRKGDLIQVSFSGIPNPPADSEERIKEDGSINLPFVGSVIAEGKTPGQLQKDIQELYVPRYYVRLTVTIKTERRVFYVDGEVRRPDRFVYEGELTLLQAIAAAQGFTDFAARGRVEIVRNTGERLVIDARKARRDRRLDVPIVPGDTITVPRRNPLGR